MVSRDQARFGAAAPASPGHAHRRGVLFMLAAIAVLPIMDAIAKALTQRYPVLQVAWARFFFAFLVLLPFTPRASLGVLLRPPRLGLQLARSLCMVLAVLLFFTTLRFLPLADTLAICFLYPLVVLALAALFLGEPVGRNRWLAALAGFLGVLIVIRPGFAVFHPAALLGLLTSVVFASFAVLTRTLAASAPPAVLLVWGTLVGTIVLSLLVPLAWVMPRAGDLALMLLMGSLGAVGHLLMLKAFEAAPAVVLAPIAYVEIVGAILLGWLVFGDLPDAATWVGTGIICAAGVYVALGAPSVPVFTRR